MIRIVSLILMIAVLCYGIFRESKPVIDALSMTEMTKLLKQPKEYDGQQVTVSGTVLDSAAIFGIGGYRLKQGDSELLVITRRGAPPAGHQVMVSGTFKQAFALNGLQYVVILEK